MPVVVLYIRQQRLEEIAQLAAIFTLINGLSQFFRQRERERKGKAQLTEGPNDRHTRDQLIIFPKSNHLGELHFFHALRQIES